MKKTHFKNLINKYINHLTNSDEEALVDKYYDKLSDSGVEEKGPLDIELQQKIWLEINHKIDLIEHRENFKISTKNSAFSLWFKVVAILILLGATSFFVFQSKVFKKPVKTDYITAIKPGGNKAILVLSNGKKIDLMQVKNGKLNVAGHQIAGKIKEDEVSFINSPSATAKPDDVNILNVPAGGFYKLVLSDGTKVSLNSSSSLSFATNFSGNTRKVKLTGEGYFEVAHLAEIPFIVETDKQEIEVLGTHFNVNAYKDEKSIKTTLLQGRVKVSTSKESKAVFLKPGEQAVLLANDLNIHQVNVLAETGWKDGYFIFKDEEIASIMRKLSRWYNVDIEYTKAIDNLTFSGKISRSKSLKEILKILTLTNDIKFKVNERRVTVMP